MVQENGRTVRDHKYHAEGIAVEGTLVLPHPAKIERQAHAQILPTTKSLEVPPRFYESQQAKPFRLEGIISYSAAHTQAAGHEETEEKGRTFKTLSTSVIENLNILNVITCDRIVAQVSTEHPRYEDQGHVPSVTFLGTQFFNLRVGGFPVEVELDLDLLNPKDGAKENVYKNPYTRKDSFLDWVSARFDTFRKNNKGSGDFMEKNDVSEDLQAYYKDQGAQDGKDCTYYSLVTGVTGKFPGTSYGNVLNIPHFGKVHLGVVRIKHDQYEGDIPKTTLIELTMVDARMGCIANGSASCCVTKNNGGTSPGIS